MKECGTNPRVIRTRVVSWQFLAPVILAAGLLGASPMLRAQSALDNLPTPSAQPQSQTVPADQTSADAGPRTFTGVIARAGDRVVLTDPLTKTHYQLDDQRKALDMVNKNVKVTGTLDPSTGTIRVRAIEPQ